MYYSNSAQSAVNSIVQAFQHPAGLPKALAYMHLQGTHSPCAKWSFANRLLVALGGHRRKGIQAVANRWTGGQERLEGIIHPIAYDCPQNRTRQKRR